MRLVETEKFDIIVDVHCPGLHGPDNEHIYFVGPKSKRFDVETSKFAAILANEAAALCIYRGNILPFGSSWNNGANFEKGMPLRDWSDKLSFVTYATSMEIPYANVGEKTLDSDMVNQFGKTFARAMLKYGEDTFPEHRSGQ